MLGGVALSRALADQGISELSVPVGRMALFLLVAAVIGVLAAVGPARRAAKLRVLDAIARAWPGARSGVRQLRAGAAAHVPEHG